MTQKVDNTGVLDLNPIFRFLKVRAHSYIQEFYRAKDRQARSLAISRCIDLSHLLWQVVIPLTSEAEMRQGIHCLARDLQSMAEHDHDYMPCEWWQHPANFMHDDGGRQLLLDRIENLENLIRLTHPVRKTARKLQEAA